MSCVEILSRKKQNVIFLWVVILFTETILPVKSQTSVCDRDLQRCMDPLREFSNTKFASTPEQLQQVCPAMLDNLHCVEDFAIQCMQAAERLALLRLFQGVREVVNGLCTEGAFRNEYLRYAPCLWEDQNEYDRCASHYSTRVRFAEAVGIGDDDVQKQICCAFHSFLTCSKSIYTLKCGAATAQFMERYLDMIAGPVIKESCAPYQHSRICSSASKDGASSWLLPLSLIAACFISGKNFYQ